MSISHTPGPWEACDPGDYGDFDGQSRVILGDDMRIAVVHWHPTINTDMSDANARLISAAPELLDALVGIVTHWEACEQGPGHSHEVPGVWDSDNHPGLAGTQCEWCAQWSKARAAISKATSRQPEGEQ